MEHLIVISFEALLFVCVVAMVLHHRYLTRGQVAHLLSEIARLEATVKSQQLILADLQGRLVEKDRLITTNREDVVAEFRTQVDSLRQQLDAAVNARNAAYDRGRDEGRQEGLRDYTIVSQPFTEKITGWFSTKYRAGYRFQLLVKGAPAFDSKTVVFQEVDEVDATVKKAILVAAQQALSLVAKAQGIPVHFGDAFVEEAPP